MKRAEMDKIQRNNKTPEKIPNNNNNNNITTTQKIKYEEGETRR
jgi:hypothetical protein